MSLGASLLQATNIVLFFKNENAGIRKFAAWRIDTEKPTEVLQNLEIQGVSFEDNAKFFEHPLETGAVIVDHVIFDPNSANVSAYISVDDAATLKELEFLYKNSIPLKIRTENKIISRGSISGKPFNVSSGHFDKDLYSIVFKEALEVSPVYIGMPKAANKSNRSRVNSGVKQAQPVKKQSWAYSGIHGGRT